MALKILHMDKNNYSIGPEFCKNTVQKFKLPQRKYNRSINHNLIKTMVENIVYDSGIRHNLRWSETKKSLNIKKKSPSFSEIMCLTLLATGRNPAQCADLLGIKEATVFTHEKRLRNKLGEKNRLHAFYLAIYNGYLSIESVK